MGHLLYACDRTQLLMQLCIPRAALHPPFPEHDTDCAAPYVNKMLQLKFLSLHDNQLRGTLPSSWSSLTNVSASSFVFVYYL